MESFTIQLTGTDYEIFPQDNGTFRVMEWEEKIGVVYPDPGTLGIEWKTMDSLEEGFAEQLGELISEHETEKQIFNFSINKLK